MGYELKGRNGGVDGIRGESTATAIEDFQEKHALPVTGKLDDKTRGAIHDEAAASREAPARGAERTEQQTPETSVAPEVAAPAANDGMGSKLSTPSIKEIERTKQVMERYQDGPITHVSAGEHLTPRAVGAKSAAQGAGVGV